MSRCSKAPAAGSWALPRPIADDPSKNPSTRKRSRCFIEILLQHLVAVTSALFNRSKFHRTYSRALDHFHRHCLNVWRRFTDRLWVDFEKIQHFFRRIRFCDGQDLMQPPFARDRSGNGHVVVSASQMDVRLIREQFCEVLLESHKIDPDIQ